jgi:hypothetical protein
MMMSIVLFLSLLALADRLHAPDIQTVRTKIGGEIFNLQVADNELAWRRGLSGQTICDSCGMLFDFGQEQPNVEMWMKDMLIGLDILWLDASGQIVATAENVSPPDCFDLELCSPDRRSTERWAQFVIELPAGSIQGMQLQR